MYYFAYASNLNKKQMQSLCPDAKPKFIAVLPNFKLIFTGWSRTYHGGLATIKVFHGEKVKGAIYEVTDACLRKLDKWETGYARQNVTVFDEDNQPIPAVTFIKTGQLEETMPSKEYGAIIGQGYRDWGIG
ncbi:MAG TPA: gamma-glutamylcyclotransferase family protein [Dehalococcoidales bacterium]|nr:gamma-glutamylcyclotransferase family protein [Dehalococcoidales bacterium]